jgi:hypothetical protein
MILMKTPWKFYSLSTGYTRLFIDLILLFFLAPFASVHYYLKLLVSIFFLTTLLFGLNAIRLPNNILSLLRLIAVLGFGADVITFPNFPYLTDLSSLISDCFYSLFIILVIFAIGFRISYENRVNLDVIRGGICLYLLLGILWFVFYQILMFFDPNAFSFPEGLTQSSLFYFSFTTLTTLGYGDITPNNVFAMTLSNAEALIGQIYPAVVIAKLVSLYNIH